MDIIATLRVSVLIVWDSLVCLWCFYSNQRMVFYLRLGRSIIEAIGGQVKRLAGSLSLAASLSGKSRIPSNAERPGSNFAASVTITITMRTTPLPHK